MNRFAFAAAVLCVVANAGCTGAVDNPCALVDCASDSQITLSFFNAAGLVMATDVSWSLDGGPATSVTCDNPICNFGVSPEDGDYTFSATVDGWSQEQTITLAHPADGECCPGVLSESVDFTFIEDEVG